MKNPVCFTESERERLSAVVALRREARRLAGDGQRRGVTSDDVVAAHRLARAAERFRAVSA